MMMMTNCALEPKSGGSRPKNLDRCPSNSAPVPPTSPHFQIRSGATVYTSAYDISLYTYNIGHGATLFSPIA